MITAERKAQLDALIQQQRGGQTPSGISPERKAQLDALIASQRGSDTQMVQSTQQPTQAQPGAFQSFVQGIAKPFEKVGATLAGIGEGAYNLLRGDTKAANEALSRERDFGYFGKARPLNIGEQGQQLSPVENLKNVTGTAAELGSYLVGGEGAAAAIKPTLGGLVKQGAVQGLKTGLISGALQGGGSEMQREGSTAGSILGQAALGAGIGGVTGGAIGGVAPVIGKGISKVVGELTPEGRIARTITNRKSELSRLESSYSDLRKFVQSQEDKGKFAKDFLAGRDYLVGSVDENGVIRTKQEGGAVEQMRKFLRPQEDVISSNIAREGKTVPLVDVAKQLHQAVNDAGFRGSAKINAMNAVENEIRGLALDADNMGNIPLSVVHDAKIDKYSNINYQNPETGRIDKSIAKGLKTFVENNVDSIDVRAVNKELSKYYGALDFLEKLDGKRVQGGKLGKYFAQTVGAIAGGHVGGPIGSVVGAEVGGRIRGATMASKFGKALNIEPEVPGILQDAVKLGRTPKPLIPESRRLMGPNESVINAGAADASRALSQAEIAQKYPNLGGVPEKKPLLALPAPDATKSGPALVTPPPTQYESRATVVKGKGQNPRTARWLSGLAKKAEVVAPTSTGSSEAALIAEAKKYKTAEEFVKALRHDKGFGYGKYGESKLYPTEIGSWSIVDIATGRKDGLVLDKLKLSNLDRGTQQDFFDSNKALGGLDGSWKDGYTVYRVVPQGKEIGAGDFVFTNKRSAQEFLEKYGSARNQTEIVSIKVTPDELVMPDTPDKMRSSVPRLRPYNVPRYDEWIYAPSDVQKLDLFDIYKKAHGKR